MIIKMSKSIQTTQMEIYNFRTQFVADSHEILDK